MSTTAMTQSLRGPRAPDRGSALLGEELEPVVAFDEPLQFGRFRLLAALGSGGMAEVFLAVVTSPTGIDKLVVLKRPLPHLRSEMEYVCMFLDEARLAARLNHPNVVQTFEAGEIDSTIYLTMEYLEGVSLYQVLRHLRRQGRRLEPLVAVRIVADILAGLAYLHELTDWDGTPLGVVHRDVTPENIFLTHEGLAKLIDFGIAKTSSRLATTSSGVVKGKWAYVAPERVKGEGDDPRVDLWSAGVVLWEALTGRRMFEGTDCFAATLRLVEHAAPSIRDIDPSLPEELDRIVCRALNRDRDQRYGSAREMLRDLERCLASSSSSAASAEIASLVTRCDVDRDRLGGLIGASEPPEHLDALRGGDTQVDSVPLGLAVAEQQQPRAPARRPRSVFTAAGILTVAFLIAVIGLFFGVTLTRNLVQADELTQERETSSSRSIVPVRKLDTDTPWADKAPALVEAGDDDPQQEPPATTTPAPDVDENRGEVERRQRRDRRRQRRWRDRRRQRIARVTLTVVNGIPIVD